MKDVYGGPGDMSGPQVLSWERELSTGHPGGRPTVQPLQDMYDFVYTYVKYSTSSGLSPRMPKPPPTSSPTTTCRAHRASWTTAWAPTRRQARPVDFLDIILAILAFALWLAELDGMARHGPARAPHDLLTWPTRELIHELLVLPGMGRCTWRAASRW